MRFLESEKLSLDLDGMSVVILAGIYRTLARTETPCKLKMALDMDQVDKLEKEKCILNMISSRDTRNERRDYIVNLLHPDLLPQENIYFLSTSGDPINLSNSCLGGLVLECGSKLRTISQGSKLFFSSHHTKSSYSRGSGEGR